MISLQNVSKIYKMGGENIFALDGINLNISRGEFLAITGPSGSGKSTLLHVIGGLDRPNQGDIFVDQLCLTSLSDQAISVYRNQKIGFIFQMFNLDSSQTAVENVALPLLFANVPKRKRNKIAASLLTWLGLGDRLEHKGSELSGGQRQRVAIARALVTRPEIILADEPTGNLDSQASQQILEILSYINQHLGVTVLLVTHDSEAAGIAPRVLRMQDGRIV
ncbi:MAG: ABC transporter ATP-binding protein [Patescibacteria group bacterium]|nr:ABC transporter ATP-binding protein [Patescibacteria group bacterium]